MTEGKGLPGGVEWLSILRDPACRGPMAAEGEGLRCTRCGERYPVVAGVPVFARAVFEGGRHRQREIFSELCRSRFEGYRTAEAYDARAIQNWKKMNAILGMGVAPGALVLDVGCADGFWLRFLAARYRVRGIGVDLADSILVAARQDRLLRYENRFCLSEAERLPLDDGSVDFVLSFDLLEHLPEPRRALEEMARVLKPGGRLLVHMPVRDYDGTLLWLLARCFPRYFRRQTEAIGHFYEQIIASGDLVRIVRGLGFGVLSAEKFGGWVQPLHDWYVAGLVGRLGEGVRRRLSPVPPREGGAPSRWPLADRPLAPDPGGRWRWARAGYLAGRALLQYAFLAAFAVIDWPLARAGIGYTVYLLAEKPRAGAAPR